MSTSRKAPTKTPQSARGAAPAKPTRSAAPAKRTPQSTRSTSALSRAALAKLASSGLDARAGARMRCSVWTTQQATAAGHAPTGPEGALHLPYLDPYTGAPTGFYRLRYLEDTRTTFQRLAGVKPLRYVQPAGTLNEVYFPPTAAAALDWAQLLADANVPLMITEGELKAACATAMGLPTLGLGGVWCFKSTRTGNHLLPQLQAVVWDQRVVYIIYDSDAAVNPNVTMAESALAHALTQLGARVHIARLPTLEDDKKCGLDDWLCAPVHPDTESAVAALQAQVLAGAYPYTEAAALHEMNTQVIYIANPGFVYDRPRKLRMRPGDFTSHQYANRFFYQTVTRKDGTQELKKVPTADSWLKWPYRAELDGLDFAPGEPEVTSNNMLNTWQGWPLAPAQGSVEPWRRLLDHLFQGDHAEERTWFERWCAYPLQYPGAKMATAALIWGITHGSGKTLVGHTLMRLYGAAHSAEIHDNDLDDERNEWAADKQFILADDIVAKGDRKLMRHIMTLITQEWMRLNPKYVPSYSVRDRANYYFTANEPDTFYMDDGDRRFFIFETAAGKYTAYKEYVAWRNSDAGIAALMHYLLTLPLGDFDPQAPAPETAAKREMLDTGKSELGHWVRELKLNTEVILKRAGMKGDLFSVKELMTLYDPSGSKGVSVNALARELRRAGYTMPGSGAQILDAAGFLQRVYVLRNMDKWGPETPRGEATAHYRAHRPGAGGPGGGKGPKF